MHSLKVSLPAIFALLHLSWSQSCPDFPIVDLGYAKHAPTRINQTYLHNVTYATYANIRFAQPPTGQKRFLKPQLPPPTESAVQNGTRTGLNVTDCLISVPADLNAVPGANGSSWGSEDCLFLDVKVPEGLRGKKVPVLHWLYGGGYVFGSKDWAGDPAALFDGMTENQKFITVSSNYRLGALGWMNSFHENMTANVGLWDGLVALQWTKDYISYFGGDPDDITVIGESSGGGMVHHLLTSWGGERNVSFRKAILTSAGYRPHVNRKADMEQIYADFLNATGCGDVSCLRQLPTEKIAKANEDLLFNIPREGWLGPTIGYGPIIDYDLVPDVPDRLLVQGRYHRSVEKVLTANMANDGRYSTASSTPTWHSLLAVFMKTPTTSALEAVKSIYPHTTGQALDFFAGDADYACHSYWTAKTWGSNAYRYSMSIPPALHGQDQYYYFDIGSPRSPVQYHDVAKAMQAYFRTFILEGRTGGGDCSNPHWPAYGNLGRWMNITAEGPKLVYGEDYQAERCELLLKLINDPANGF